MLAEAAPLTAFASGVVAEDVALVTSGPEDPARTTTVTVALAPAARLPRSQWTASVQVPAVGAAIENCPPGAFTLRLTPVAVSGPAFVILKRWVTSPPAATDVREDWTVTDTSVDSSVAPMSHAAPAFGAPRWSPPGSQAAAASSAGLPACSGLVSMVPPKAPSGRRSGSASLCAPAPKPHVVPESRLCPTDVGVTEFVEQLAGAPPAVPPAISVSL